MKNIILTKGPFKKTNVDLAIVRLGNEAKFLNKLAYDDWAK